AKIKLKKVERYNFRVGSLKDTSYKNTDLLQEWEQFYLPDEMKMVVIGVLENFPCGEDSAELVLMVCEDGNVFAYEDERLHLVASSLKELLEFGVHFPGSTYYHCGQSFEDMVRIMAATIDMLESIKPTLLRNLKIIKQRLQEEVNATLKIVGNFQNKGIILTISKRCCALVKYLIIAFIFVFLQPPPGGREMGVPLPVS
uniref:Uncharacterized protein n=1 Tax=Astyanax mexicanus TaxID=7994 RepID=A0A8B9GN02_ASTMX